jgi:hypothetical protein
VALLDNLWISRWHIDGPPFADLISWAEKRIGHPIDSVFSEKLYKVRVKSKGSEAKNQKK